jgi:hypothetical protein
MFNLFYERKVNNKIFSFQTNLARLGALTRGYPDSFRIPRPLVRLGFYFRRVQPGQNSALKIDVHYITAINGIHPTRPSRPYFEGQYIPQTSTWPGDVRSCTLLRRSFWLLRTYLAPQIYFALHELCKIMSVMTGRNKAIWNLPLEILIVDGRKVVVLLSNYMLSSVQQLV